MHISFYSFAVRRRSMNGSVPSVLCLFSTLIEGASCIECRLDRPARSSRISLARLCISQVRFLKKISSFLRCRSCTFLRFSSECSAASFFGLLICR